MDVKKTFGRLEMEANSYGKKGGYLKSGGWNVYPVTSDRLEVSPHKTSRLEAEDGLHNR